MMEDVNINYDKSAPPTIKDICAQMDIENKVVDLDLIEWDVFMIKLKNGSVLMSLLAKNLSSISDNYLIQLPLIVEVISDAKGNNKIVFIKYGFMSNDLFYYIPKSSVIGISFASAEANNAYEKGIEVYYPVADIEDDEPEPTGLSEMIAGLEDFSTTKII